jgi:hypothetical protein
MVMKILKAIGVCWLSSINFFVFGQSNTIEIDRLGKTQTPFTVPKRWVQSEIGFLKQVDKDPMFSITDKYFQHPVFFGRYGLSNRLEARIITEWATEKIIDNQSIDAASGINNFQLGLKANICNERGIKPEIALIGHYSFSKLRTINKISDTLDGANFRFVFQHTFSETFRLNYNIGMDWRYFTRQPFFVYTLSPRFKFDDNWIAFVEIFGFLRKKYKPQHSLSAGLGYNINDNFRLDVSGGVKLNRHTPDYFFSIGSSFRFRTATRNN